jgi:release factor glutamine methyltransferase
MKDAQRIWLKDTGEVYVPCEFSDIADLPLKLFGSKELDKLNKIFNHIRRGGVAVMSGKWEKILELLAYLEKKKRELANVEAQRIAPKSYTGRLYERHYQQILSRVMVIAQNDRLPYIEPNIHIPYLLELLGEKSGLNEGLPFLVPVSTIQKLQADMEQTYYIPSLDMGIVAHSNVLPPLSQDTIELFLEALQDIETRLVAFKQKEMQILDMGCGCGVLSLLAAKTFTRYTPGITATDILPEAIATTRINIRRFMESNDSTAYTIETTQSGDLFQPVSNRRFDLIIFNVPWVISPSRSRVDVAICDEKQGTLRRFLNHAPGHLKENGHIILGYSDHSGEKALDNLRNFVENTGLKIDRTYKKRVQSRSHKRKWETILVYELSF